MNPRVLCNGIFSVEPPRSWAAWLNGLHHLAAPLTQIAWVAAAAPYTRPTVRFRFLRLVLRLAARSM